MAAAQVKTSSKYFYALGRRKTAVVTVRIFPGKGESTVNGLDPKSYFKNLSTEIKLASPFKTIDSSIDQFHFTAKAKGSGLPSQLDALVLAISRALVVMDENNKPPLRRAGLMTRDSRMVERKKTGLPKARKREQFSKR